MKKRIIVKEGWLANIAAGVLLAAVAVMAAGCGDEAESSWTECGEVPLQVAGGTVGAEAMTRASAITSGSIGICRTTDNNYPALYNVEYTYNGGWKPANASHAIYLSQLNATLCAYYPYRSTFLVANSWKTQLMAQKYDAAQDVSYATSGGSNVCNKTPSATFVMKRAFARLKMTLKRHATNYVGTGVVSNINLKNGVNFYATRTLDITNHTIGGSETSGGWTYAFDTTVAAGTTNTDYDVLLPPQALNNGLTITLTIDGMNRSVTVPTDKFPNGSFEAGKVYSIGLEITAAQIIPDGSITGDDFGGQGNTDYELKLVVVEVDDFNGQENTGYEVRLP